MTEHQKPSMSKTTIISILLLLLVFTGPLWVYFNGYVSMDRNWRSASRHSAQTAPLPKQHPEAVVQVYSARAFFWRGLFATHTWISVKPPNASQYIVYQVIGWNKYAGRPILSIVTGIPDRYWFNNPPHIVKDLRGAAAEKLILPIDAAARRYPFASRYDAWPGPNSNTFTAFVGREVPELGLSMPSIAIGKDFFPVGHYLEKTPSNTGWEFSLYGLFSITLAKAEGFELNLLGLVFGLNPFKPSFKWPGVGEVSLLSHTTGASA